MKKNLTLKEAFLDDDSDTYYSKSKAEEINQHLLKAEKQIKEIARSISGAIFEVEEERTYPMLQVEWLERYFKEAMSHINMALDEARKKQTPEQRKEKEAEDAGVIHKYLSRK